MPNDLLLKMYCLTDDFQAHEHNVNAFVVVDEVKSFNSDCVGHHRRGAIRKNVFDVSLEVIVVFESM